VHVPLELARVYTRSLDAVPASLAPLSIHPPTTKGAPAFKPATKGRLVSPAVRPEKKVLTTQTMKGKWAPAVPKACFNVLSGSQKSQSWCSFVLA
jgi:hypothetical protein